MGGERGGLTSKTPYCVRLRSKVICKYEQGSYIDFNVIVGSVDKQYGRPTCLPSALSGE